MNRGGADDQVALIIVVKVTGNLKSALKKLLYHAALQLPSLISQKNISSFSPTALHHRLTAA
jgi:hypothetical protein